jgi:hypothetical protein
LQDREGRGAVINLGHGVMLGAQQGMKQMTARLIVVGDKDIHRLLLTKAVKTYQRFLSEFLVGKLHIFSI